MKTPVAVFITVLAFILVATAVLFSWFWRHRPKNESRVIVDLIARLTPLDEALLRASIDPSEAEGVDNIATLLAHIGSWSVLLRNCEILTDLAEKIQVTHPEALLLAEELRRTAGAIDWHLDRLGPLVGGGNEEWLEHYGTTVLRSYLTAMDGFLVGCDAISNSLHATLRVRVWRPQNS